MNNPAESEFKNPVDLGHRVIIAAGNSSEIGGYGYVEAERVGGGFKTQNFIMAELQKRGILEDFNFDEAGYYVQLSYDGWEIFQKLSQGQIGGSSVFFAHQFGDDEISEAMKKFAAVCKRCGYRAVDLETTNDLKAGRINDRIELEIKLSKFVIADLTKNNNGAYWEAGFAAGFGRKVIYTCQQDFFDTARTHFDVNHHMTILWQSDNLGVAEESLEACIRNTFTDENSGSAS